MSSISSTTCAFVAKCGKFFTIGKNAKFHIFHDTVQRTAMLFIGNIYIASCTDRVFGQLFGKWFALCYRSQTVVLSCLSVTLAYCGQMVGWIKIKLGVEIHLGPGHIALDGDPAPTKRGTAPPQFLAMSIVAKQSPMSAAAELLSFIVLTIQ